MKSERNKIIIALIVFVVTFLVFREIFSNWDKLFGK